MFCLVFPKSAWWPWDLPLLRELSEQRELRQGESSVFSYKWNNLEHAEGVGSQFQMERLAKY